jgi:hypothetical protein
VFERTRVTEACLEDEVADPDFSRLNDSRTFSLTRYTLSLHLPRIIETICFSFLLPDHQHVIRPCNPLILRTGWE